MVGKNHSEYDVRDCADQATQRASLAVKFEIEGPINAVAFSVHAVGYAAEAADASW